MNCLEKLAYYSIQIPHIFEWMVKKGYCGRKAQICYYLECDNVFINDISNWQEEFEKIRGEFVGIRVWKNNCASRIGEYLPRVRMVARYHEEHEDGWLDVIYDPNYEKNNSRLAKIIERNIPILHKGNITKWANILYRIDKVDYSLYNKLASRSWDKRIYKSEDFRYLFELSEKEISEANKKLNCMGIGDNEEYVCFANRDSAFLKSLDPLNDWSYHDYRNTTVQNYNTMIEYLAKSNIKTVRLGKEAGCNYVYKGSIDYASNYYSELMDVFLPQRAMFCVVPCGGIMDLSLSVNDNVLLVNVVPQLCDGWAGIPFTKNTIQIFKKLYSKEKGRFLTLAETAEADVDARYDGAKYSEMGLVYVENTAEEILLAVIEMRERILGTWKETMEDKHRQEIFQNFREEICNQFGISSAHAYNCRVGSRFLEKNWDWMGL